MLIIGKSLRISTFTPAKLLNNPFGRCSLRNFNFLLSHNAHFDKSIILPFLVFTTCGFVLSVFFLHFKLFYASYSLINFDLFLPLNNFLFHLYFSV